MHVIQPTHTRVISREIRSQGDKILICRLECLRRRVCPGAEVMIAGQKHLGERVLRIHTNEIARVQIVRVRSRVGRVLRDGIRKRTSRPAIVIFRRADQDFGGAQFVRHHAEHHVDAPVVGRIARDLSDPEAFRSAALSASDSHGVLVVVIERPCAHRQADLFQVIRAIDALRAGFGTGQCRQQHGRQDGDNRDYH